MLGQTCETLRQALYMTCLLVGRSVCLSCGLSIRHPAIYLYIYMGLSENRVYYQL